MSLYDYNRQNSQQPLIHKDDNTVQYSNDVLAIKLGVASKTIQRLFKAMRDDDLMRTIVDNQGNKRYMVNPAFHKIDVSKYEQLFMQALYHTGSHDDTIVWARLCRYDYKLYDYKSFIFDSSTGEVVLDAVRPLLHDEVESWINDVNDLKAILTEQALMEYDLGLSLAYVPCDKDMMDACMLNASNPAYDEPQVHTTLYQKLGIAYKYIDSLGDTAWTFVR